MFRIVFFVYIILSAYGMLYNMVGLMFWRSLNVRTYIYYKNVIWVHFKWEWVLLPPGWFNFGTRTLILSLHVLFFLAWAISRTCVVRSLFGFCDYTFNVFRSVIVMTPFKKYPCGQDFLLQGKRHPLGRWNMQ